MIVTLLAGGREGADTHSCLDTVENGHLHIHQHDVISAVAHRIDRLLAVLDGVHLVSDRAQDHRGQLLIDLVVLGDEDVQRPRRGWRNP